MKFHWSYLGEFDVESEITNNFGQELHVAYCVNMPRLQLKAEDFSATR